MPAWCGFYFCAQNTTPAGRGRVFLGACYRSIWILCCVATVDSRQSDWKRRRHHCRTRQVCSGKSNSCGSRHRSILAGGRGLGGSFVAPSRCCSFMVCICANRLLCDRHHQPATESTSVQRWRWLCVGSVQSEAARIGRTAGPKSRAVRCLRGIFSARFQSPQVKHRCKQGVGKIWQQRQSDPRLSLGRTQGPRGRRVACL
jgi:hypothetical protein